MGEISGGQQSYLHSRRVFLVLVANIGGDCGRNEWGVAYQDDQDGQDGEHRRTRNGVNGCYPPGELDSKSMGGPVVLCKI